MILGEWLQSSLCGLPPPLNKDIELEKKIILLGFSQLFLLS